MAAVRSNTRARFLLELKWKWKIKGNWTTRDIGSETHFLWVSHPHPENMDYMAKTGANETNNRPSDR
eukprot:scaffold840_cov344-Pavlova_lutheri.AAC.88